MGKIVGFNAYRGDELAAHYVPGFIKHSPFNLIFKDLTNGSLPYLKKENVCFQLVWQQDRNSFKEDVSGSVKLLEDITGKPVRYFRAPGFSIRGSEAWAFEVIQECGIEIDCSVFPARHAHGGIPSYGKAVPSIISHEGVRIKEFPICTKEIGGRHIIFSGGGYFRLFPYWLIRKWAGEKSGYMISYIHPRDLDAGQPMIGELPWSRKFKSYVGLKGAEKKLRRLLTDFSFTDLAAADRMVDWTNVPVVEP